MSKETFKHDYTKDGRIIITRIVNGKEINRTSTSAFNPARNYAIRRAEDVLSQGGGEKL